MILDWTTVGIIGFAILAGAAIVAVFLPPEREQLATRESIERDANELRRRQEGL